MLLLNLVTRPLRSSTSSSIAILPRSMPWVYTYAQSHASPILGGLVGLRQGAFKPRNVHITHSNPERVLFAPPEVGIGVRPGC